MEYWHGPRFDCVASGLHKATVTPIISAQSVIQSGLPMPLLRYKPSYPLPLTGNKWLHHARSGIGGVFDANVAGVKREHNPGWNGGLAPGSTVLYPGHTKKQGGLDIKASCKV